MRNRIHGIHGVAFPSEIADFTDEVRQVFLELGRVFGADSLAGECAPAIDVYETDDTMEIVVDLPGADASAVRVLMKGDAVLIVGEKPPRRVRGESSFHLVERGYGRFARAVRMAQPCDASMTQAALVNGELRISLRKIAERRGRSIPIRLHSRTADE